MTLQKRLHRKIAVLFDAIEDDYQSEILEGIEKEAEHSDCQVICLAGGVVQGEDGARTSGRNFLFDLFDPASVDGLLVLSGALSNAIGPERFTGWMQRFSRIPVVNLGLPVAGMESIVIRSGEAMYKLVEHVIKVHGRERVVLLRGPLTSQDAHERFLAYQSALGDLGVPFDPALVVQGNWLRESGRLAVTEILDARKIELRGVGAIVSSNDYMALGALDALLARGIDVPEEVLLTGFNDLRAARSSVPPLTSARQPTQELGAAGVRRLLSQIQTRGEPIHTELSSQVVHRASCGCHAAAPLLVDAGVENKGAGLHAMLLKRRAVLAAELARAARGSLSGVGSGWEERIINAFLTDMTSQQGSALHTLVDKMIAKLMARGGEVGVLHGVLDALRRGVRPALEQDARALLRATDLFDSVRRLIGDTVARAEAHKSTEAARLLRALVGVAGTFFRKDRTGGRAQREKDLLAVGVETFCLSAFDSPGEPSGHCQIEALLSGGSSLKDTSFEAIDLAPSHFLSACRGPVLIQPLLWEEEALGLLAFPLGMHEGPIYEQARETLSLGLHGHFSEEARVEHLD